LGRGRERKAGEGPGNVWARYRLSRLCSLDSGELGKEKREGKQVCWTDLEEKRADDGQDKKIAKYYLLGWHLMAFFPVRTLLLILRATPCWPGLCRRVSDAGEEVDVLLPRDFSAEIRALRAPAWTDPEMTERR